MFMLICNENGCDCYKKDEQKKPTLQKTKIKLPFLNPVIKYRF